MQRGQGRATIDAMLARRQLARVPPSRSHADVLITQAAQHLEAARAIASIDPTGAYQLVYDAARKSFNAVLEAQGLRATSHGGHIAVREAILAQLDPPLGDVLRPFDRLRRRRNEAEYPSADSPPVTVDEVARDLPKVEEMVAALTAVLDEALPY